MGTSFSNALELNGMSSTTTIVVWSMIAFLILLAIGVGFVFKKQIDLRQNAEEIELSKKSPPKGFE